MLTFFWCSSCMERASHSKRCQSSSNKHPFCSKNRTKSSATGFDKFQPSLQTERRRIVSVWRTTLASAQGRVPYRERTFFSKLSTVRGSTCSAVLWQIWAAEGILSSRSTIFVATNSTDAATTGTKSRGRAQSRSLSKNATCKKYWQTQPNAASISQSTLPRQYCWHTSLLTPATRSG